MTEVVSDNTFDTMEKRVLVVVTDNCGPIETVTLAETLSRFGAKVTIASIHPGGNLTCQMKHRIKIQADMTIKRALDTDWDLIAIPGCENSSRPLNECVDLINLITKLRSKGKLLTCVHQNFFRDDNDDPMPPEKNGQSHQFGDGVHVLQGPGTALKVAIEIGGALYTKEKAKIVAAKMSAVEAAKASEIDATKASIVDDMSGFLRYNFTKVEQLINMNKTLLVELKNDIADHKESKQSGKPSVTLKKKNNSKVNAKLETSRKRGELNDVFSSPVNIETNTGSGRIIKTPSRSKKRQRSSEGSASSAKRSGGGSNKVNMFHTVVWPFLLENGWTKENGNRPCDHFYIPPGIKRGGKGMKNRRDYFDSINQVINMIKNSEEWNAKSASTMEEFYEKLKNPGTKKDDKMVVPLAPPDDFNTALDIAMREEIDTTMQEEKIDVTTIPTYDNMEQINVLRSEKVDAKTEDGRNAEEEINVTKNDVFGTPVSLRPVNNDNTEQDSVSRPAIIDV